MKIRHAVLLALGAFVCVLVLAFFWISYAADPTANKYVYLWQQYYWPGQLAGQAKREHFSGEYCEYYRNGRLFSVAMYRDGQRHGLTEEYGISGGLAARRYFDEDFEIEGRTTEWYPGTSHVHFRDEIYGDEVLSLSYDTNGRCESVDWRKARTGKEDYHKPSGVRKNIGLEADDRFRVIVRGREFSIKEALGNPECDIVIERALPMLDSFYRDMFVELRANAKAPAGDAEAQPAGADESPDFIDPSTEE